MQVSSGSAVASSLRSSMPGCSAMRRVSASLKATRSTASASPAGTRARSASSRTADPRRRSSSWRSPMAFSGLSERSEFEHTSSASASDLCAGERRTGFCSTRTTRTPAPASRSDASDPASPPPMTITLCTAICLHASTRSRNGCSRAATACRKGARLLPLPRGCPASGVRPPGGEFRKALVSENGRLRRHLLPGLRGLAPVPARLVGAGDVGPLALRVLREEVRLAALRARPRDGPVPRRELAVRVVHAAVERLAEPGAPLGQPAAIIGADHVLEGDGARRLAVRVVAAGEEAAEPPALVDHRLAAGGARLVGGQVLDDLDLAVLLDEVLGVLAVRIAGAGQEPPHADHLDDHGLAALLACEICGLLLALHVAHVLIGDLEALLEGLVELVEHLHPLHLAFLDLVELVLHPGGELDVEDARERVDQELVDDLAQVGGEEAVLLLLHVLLVLDGGEDGRVGRRAPDALLFQLLHQRRLGEAR